MANTTIPNLPPATGLTGAEQLEAVQGGTSVRLTAAQIAALAQNTQGTVTQINTAGALTGGPITTTGTISLPPNAVTNTYLAPMAAGTLKGNLSGLSANPSDVTPSAVLDTFATAAGSLLYRDAGVWAGLAPGLTGQYLSTTGGAPQWVSLSIGPGDLQPTGVVPGTYGTASTVPQFTVNAAGQITGAVGVSISIPAGQVSGLGTMATQNASAVTITGGTLDGITLGSNNPGPAYFTTVLAGSWQGNPVGLAYGGTGGTDAATARANLGLGSMAVQNANGVAITGGTMEGVTIGSSNPQAGTFSTLTASSSSLGTVTSGTWNGTAIAVADGGTGATTAGAALVNLGAAARGANSDITSLSGLTTPLSATQGGTGFANYTTGDLLYATSSTTLGRLNDVATGNVLRSGGVGVAPAWGKADLTTDVTGTLPVANGGTGAASLTGYVFGNGTGAFTASTVIPISALQFNGVTIGSTPITLGSIATTLSGLTSITLTQNPVSNLQVATKQYVDTQTALVANTTYHAPAVATSTANLTATYNNGTNGVGATLTNSGAQAQFQTDGITPALGARVLVRNQTNQAENGIYTVTDQGSISTNWVLTRATDYDTIGIGPDFIQTASAVIVTSGNLWQNSGWLMNTTGTLVVGTSPFNWIQIAAAGFSGTVTSIDVSGGSTGLTTSGGPVLTSGVITLGGTLNAGSGGTGISSYVVGDILYADTTTTLAKLAAVATGNVLRSAGTGAAPAWGQVALATDVSGTLPVANGGTGTGTAFTAGSVVFAGASGVYSQNNGDFFWDNTNNRLGINTAAPTSPLTIVSNTQTALPPGALPSGTDLHIVGADNADARITQDAFGTGNYVAYTGRHARGTAAAPTATQSGDVLVQYTARGYGATAYNSASTGVLQFQAAENFTDTAQGTYASLRLTATNAASPAEVMRFGPVGQLGVGGSNYGTANQILTSGGASAAPSWQSGIDITTLTASGAVTMSATTDNIAIGGSQTTGTLSLGGASQTGNVTLGPSTKAFTLAIGGGATESAATKTINLGTGGVSGSTTAINIGTSTSGATSTTTLFGSTVLNALTASKVVFTDGSKALTSTGTVATDQGGTGLSSWAVGDIPYYAAGTALSKLTIGTNGQVLTSNGTAPAWAAASTLSVGTASNLAGGAGGSLPYQTALNTTGFLAIGAANRVLTSSGTAPQWVTALTGLTGVSSSSITNTSLTSGRVVYSTTGGAQTDSANLTFDGTTLTANALNLSGGTANGVLYLNASKVATSGSVLTFNGADLDIGVGAAYGTLNIKRYSTAPYASITLTDPVSVANEVGLYLRANGTNPVGISSAGAPIAFYTGGPGVTERMRLDSSGNLGLGVSPSAWSSGKAYETTAAGNALWALSNEINVTQNAYFNSGWKYGATGAAARYQQQSGEHKWNIAASGTAGNAITFTQAMTLDASSRLALNGTDATVGGGQAVINHGSNNGLVINQTAATSPATLYLRNAVDSTLAKIMFVNGLTFADQNGNERMRLDSSGNLGIGTSSPGSKLEVNGVVRVNVASANDAQLTLRQAGWAEWYVRVPASSNSLTFTDGSSGTPTERMRLDASGNLGIGTSSPGAKLEVYGGASGTVTNTQVGNASTAFVLGVDSGNNCQIRTAQNVPIIFYTNATRRASIEASGSVVAGGGALATTATDGFLYVPTCAGTPTGTPTAITGMAPIVVDTTNNKMYFYSGGQWRDAGP